MTMSVGSLFSGIGGFELGLERAGGFSVRWQVESDPFARTVLSKHWPDVPRFDDVRTFPPGGEEDDLRVDLICGGFPCQDVSNAKTAQEAVPRGLSGEKSGLWHEFSRVVRALRPRWILVENVGTLNVRGLGAVLWDLSSEGYAAEWSTLSAGALGAPHLRRRMFIVAVADPDGTGLEGRLGQVLAQSRKDKRNPNSPRSDRWDPEPEVGRVVDGLPPGVDGRRRYPRGTKPRVRTLGNAVVPAVAEFIGRRIMEAEHDV
jgi:DNA (cytosine-5)-methyltransferase 1